jgi:hypothetical protein
MTEYISHAVATLPWHPVDVTDRVAGPRPASRRCRSAVFASLSTPRSASRRSHGYPVLFLVAVVVRRAMAESWQVDGCRFESNLAQRHYVSRAEAVPMECGQAVI